MLSKIRRRMTWANVAMTLALVFAMSGGAYAAKKYLITSTKQISPKVLKQLQGKAGPAGAQGPAGPAGPQAPAGPKGETGLEGKVGKDGAIGKSVISSAASGTECKEGGTKLEVEGSGTPSHVCNGEKGVIHPRETLPSEASETGVWYVKPPESVVVTASFPIPLAHPIAESHIKLEPEGYAGGGEGCPGTAQKAEAEPGFFCLYVQTGEEATLAQVVPPTVDGAIAVIVNGEAFGTWAVTEE
jgi:hypothetical protein